MKQKTYKRLLLGLMAIRLAMMALLVQGIPRLIVKDGWYFHHGGDQDLMFDAARSILAGHPAYTYVGAGMPVVMAGLLRLFHADTYLQIVVPLVLINGFLLGSLSIAVMAALAMRLADRRDVALAAAAVWTLLPYIFYALFGLHPDAALFRDSYLPLLLWANGLSEGPSLFLFLLGLVLVLRGVDGGSRWPLFAAGLAFGFGSAIRIHTLASVGVVLGLLVLRRDWRRLAALLPGMVIGYFPQFWYSRGYSGTAFNIPYIQNWLSIDHDGRLLVQLNNTPFAPQFLIANILGIAGRHPMAAAAGLTGLVAGAFGLVRYWRRHGWFKALLLAGVPLGTWIFHAFTYVFADDPFRFSIPAFPLLIVLGVYAAVAVTDTIRSRPVVPYAEGRSGIAEPSHAPGQGT